MNENFQKYMKLLQDTFQETQDSDFTQLGCKVFAAVDKFCTTKQLTGHRVGAPATFALESLSLDSVMAKAPIDSLKTLVKDCGVPDAMNLSCCQKILTIMDRTVGRSSAEAWDIQHMSAENMETYKGGSYEDLGKFHSAGMLSAMNEATFSNEAFGADMDKVVPDMKINIAIAIMSFHARILPRLLPQRPTNEPLVQYKKEKLEVYDLSDPNGKRISQIQLYSDPSFVSTELKRVVPRTACDTAGKYVVADGVLKFGVRANLLQLALDATKYGYDAFNRTDILDNRVSLDFVRVNIVSGSKTEEFDVKPGHRCELTHQINSDLAGDRAGSFRYSVILAKSAQTVAGAASEILAGLGANEQVILSFNVKPNCCVQDGFCDAEGSVSLNVVATDGAALSAAATALKAGTITLKGYSLDARYDETNLRKSNTAIWSNTQPMAYPIPNGSNFIYDYALNQQNSEKIAADMMGVMGVTQDKDAMRQITDICNQVFDSIKQAKLMPEGNGEGYIGKFFVAGDKVKPTVYMDTLDFSTLNVIRDGDRSGDIKQKAITFLGAVTGRILNESFFQQQLGGKSQVIFKCWCSIEILSNIIGQVLYNPGIAEDTRGNLGDGVEYSLVLPNKVRLDFVTTTFADQQNKIVGIAVVDSPESELNFGHNWDYGVLVSHYTVSGKIAHNRLFSNMRYLIVPTNPIAFVIDVTGVDVVTDMALDGNLRPNLHVSGEITTLNFTQQNNQGE